MKRTVDPSVHGRASYSLFALARDIRSFVSPHWIRLLVVSLIRFLGELSWLYPSYAIAELVRLLTTYKPGDSLDQVYAVLALWLFVSIWKRWGDYYSTRYGANAGEHIQLSVQQQAILKLFSLDISWHEKENAGNKVKRIERGAFGINRLVRIWVMNCIGLAVQLIGIVAIVSRFDQTLAIATLGFLVIFYLVSRWYKRHSSAASRVVNHAEEEMAGLLYESVNNIRSVKVMSMVPWLSRLIAQKTEDLYTKITMRVAWNQKAGYAKNMLAQLFRLGTVSYIVYTITLGVHDVSFLVLYYGYLNYLWTAIEKLVDIELDIELAKIAIGRMMDIFDEPVGVENERGKKDFPKNWKKIQIVDLSFTYHRKKVLDRVSFTIKRGEKVGIMGLSGAGKTTLFKLLLKEHENYTGKILIDDIPLKRIKKSSYFGAVAAVLQETEVFNMPLRDNIAISNLAREGDQELLDRSIDIAHVRDFLSKLPMGVDTPIGEKGIKLSGGERQRVGIARAVYKEPEILFLDEATSHLDVESEKRIQDSLHEFFQTVTAVVIAHRLTTIREMDRIIVLEGGRIVESGSFSELYAKRGRFHQLWEKQKL